jgi:phage terminase small subunit
VTPKQQRFVDEYLIDCNATQAAIRAGYSSNNADVTGPRLLGNVGIRAAVDAAQVKVSADLGITREYVLKSLREIGEEARQAGERTPSIRCFELLGKSLGMFSDKPDTSLADIPKLSDDELAKRRKSLKLA